MLKNYINTALRHMRKHRLNTFINLLGLATGLACCLVVWLFVQQERSFDRFHENLDEIYWVDGHLGDRQMSSTPILMLPALVDEVPEVEHGTRLFTTSLVTARDQMVQSARAAFVDPAFFDMFSFPLMAGTADMEALQSVVLTAEQAALFFPNADPVGQSLTLFLNDTPYDFTVTGIAASLPATSSLQFDLVLPYQSTALLENASLEPTWDDFMITSFVQLAPHATPEALDATFSALIGTHMRPSLEDAGHEVSEVSFSLSALRTYRFSERSVSGLQAGTDPSYLYLLSVIAGLILLIACFNFTSLAIGQASSRLQEIGMRKTLGAHRGQLIRQFCVEALAFSTLALGAGLLLAQLLVPVFNNVAGTTLSLEQVPFGSLLLVSAALLLTTGLLAGSYPALVLARVPNIQALSGRLSMTRNPWMTRGLVVAQFGISIGLLAATVIMYQQQTFIQDYDLGYDTEQVVVIPTQVAGIRDARGDETLAHFRQVLGSQSGVRHLSGSSGSFARGGFGTRAELEDGTTHMIAHYRVDPDYLETLGITLAQGRNFSPDRAQDATGSVIVNETFARTFDTPVGTVLTEHYGQLSNLQIIGITDDYHFFDLRQSIIPAALHMNDMFSTRFMLVKIAPDRMPETLAALETAWQEIRPNVPFDYHFLDDDLDRQYRSETLWRRAINYASAIAVLLAALGLFGLTTLSTTRRTKEIGIRKILGASVPGLFYLIVREFVLLILVAAVLVTPIVYFFMDEWLSNFAYHVTLTPLPFVVAGVLAFAVALFTTSSQSFRIAQTNPVESLRYE